MDVTDTTEGQLKGTVTNLGNQSVENVIISGIFYDKNHTVIDVSTDLVLELFPRDKLPFTLFPVNNFLDTDKISTYTVTVQSPEFSMIPPVTQRLRN